MGLYDWNDYMNKQMFYELLKDNICIQDEALRKLIWALYNNFYGENNIRENILLIGDRGSGKTTMLKETAALMDIPFGEVYNAFSSGEINYDLIASGLFQMNVNGNNDGEGILLLHDFQDSFIYGHSQEFNAMMASQILSLGDYGYFNASGVTFVGEIDTDNVRNIFNDDRSSLSDLDTDDFVSPTLNLLKSYLSNANKIKEDKNGNRTANIGFEKYISDVIRNRFLTSTCLDVFERRIYMEDMGTDEIVKALSSPISVLNLYKDDLLEEYIDSDMFRKRVASYILESGEGLHATSSAIENTFMTDVKHNKKVLKKGSLFIPTKK